MTTKLTIAVSALALAATLGLTGPAFAKDQSTVASEVVHYSDLNLSTPAGARALYERIQNASVRVCWHLAPAGVLNLRCRMELVGAAVADVNQPALTALHTGKAPDQRTAQR